MTYAQQGDRVTLEMTRGNFDQLMLLVGRGIDAFSIDAFSKVPVKDPETIYALLRFTNELNNGNPDYTPYEIPEEYTTKGAER